MSNEMMIDLETFGTSARALIVQVGWVIFNQTLAEPIVETRQVNVDFHSALSCGGELDGDTINWWMTQTQEARDSISAKPRVSMSDVHQALEYSYKKHNCTRVWSHGATFDIVILNEYFRKLKRPTPWHYAHARDTRTLFDFAEGWGWENPLRSKETAHTAAEDARQQALAVISARRFLAEKMIPSAPAPNNEVAATEPEK